MDKETARLLLKTPEHKAATWSTATALFSTTVWGPGVWIWSLTGQDIVCFSALLLVLLLWFVSVRLALFALRYASNNSISPRQVRGWAIVALLLNAGHFLFVSTVIVLFLSSGD